MNGEEVELFACQRFADEMSPYERLLSDAMRGDASLFAREDAVEATWRIVDPVLANVTTVHEYDPGTWGPPEADRIIADNGCWENPKQSETAE
jgi:glucose-6-phosphate 1-dehydrogenase